MVNNRESPCYGISKWINTQGKNKLVCSMEFNMLNPNILRMLLVTIVEQWNNGAMGCLMGYKKI